MNVVKMLFYVLQLLDTEQHFARVELILKLMLKLN